MFCLKKTAVCSVLRLLGFGRVLLFIRRFVKIKNPNFLFLYTLQSINPETIGSKYSIFNKKKVRINRVHVIHHGLLLCPYPLSRHQIGISLTFITLRKNKRFYFYFILFYCYRIIQRLHVGCTLEKDK